VWGPRFLHTAEVTGSIPVTPTSTNSLLDLALSGACQKTCQKTTLSRRENALSAVRFEGLDKSALTPCSQSQIGPIGHLRLRETAEVEVAVALSVIVRWEPARTAVNGTVVARSARTTFVSPGRVGTSSTAW
jgi:hypothetical protein